MEKIEVSSSKAPAAIGPYSQAVLLDKLVFISGQLPVDVETEELDGNDIITQTTRSFENIKAILNELGLGMEHVLKTTVFLQDLKTFADMNAVYETYFVKPYPARSSFEVAALPKGALVEIEVIAYVK